MKSNNIIKEIQTLDKRVKYILIAGAVVLILIPILATQFDWLFDFTETGQIGDTIGGLTAPVIGSISALLIYFSFRAQINANRIIQEQIDEQREKDEEKKEFNYQMELYKHLKEKIEEFYYNDLVRNKFFKGKKESTALSYTGAEGIFKFLEAQTIFGRKQKINTESISFSLLKSILELFKKVISRIEISKEKEYDTALIESLIELQFNSAIWSNLGNLTIKILSSKENEHPYIVSIYYEISKLNNIIRGYNSNNKS